MQFEKLYRKSSTEENSERKNFEIHYSDKCQNAQHANTTDNNMHAKCYTSSATVDKIHF